MGEQIAGILESFVRESIAFIVNGCFTVCMEFLKFFLILLILYYFALWSFRALEQLSVTDTIPTKLVTTNYFRTDYSSDMERVVSETFLRVGAPDEKLIKRRASLLEQLEIEAEFEENIKQHTKSENSSNNPENHNNAITSGNIREVVPFKDLFISKKQYDSNETSQPSQTTKTSLGKKSMPREENVENETEAIATVIDQPDSNKLWQDNNVEFDTDRMQPTSAEHETTSS